AADGYAVLSRVGFFSIGTHEVEQGGSDGERDQVVDDVEHDKFADLAPDFGFVSGADVQEQGIEHFAGVIASEDALEAAPNRGKRNAHDIGMVEGGIKGQTKEEAHLFGGKSGFPRG